MADGWLGGPHPFTCDGDLFVDGGDAHLDPSCRFGAQRGRKLGASGDLKTSDANRATAIRAPGNLPLSGDVVREAEVLRKMDRRVV